MRRSLVILTLLLGILAGCGSEMDNETYVGIILAKTSYMLEDELPVNEALERAATDYGVTPDEVLRFEESLANDPEHLGIIVEMIMNESEELREKFAELYSQALPEVALPEEPTPAEEVQ